MKSINWKKSLLFCISFNVAFFAEIAVNIACGPEQDPYDYYVSYFHNNVQGDDYTPFAFNEMVNLYSDEEVEDEGEINSEEWAKYLSVKKGDVYQVMYKADSVTSIKLARLSAKSYNNLPDSLKQNSFVQSLLTNESALKYFLFAKSCEPLAMANYDSWNPVPRDSGLMEKKADEAIANAKAEKDQFLKLRYAYQALRMQHYAGYYGETETTYQQLIEPLKSNSAVKGWAMAIYAGAVRYLGNADKGAYLFSKVFASNPERRVLAYKNYLYTGSSLDATLKFVKNNNEKASILGINAFHNPSPDLAGLEKVYENDPTSLITGALLTREVNKLEQRLIKESDLAKNYYTNYAARWAEENKSKEDSIRNASLIQLTKVREFSLKLARDKKYPQPALGFITAAYLSWLENKPAQALVYLGEVKNDAQLTERLKDQSRIVQLLCIATKINNGVDFNEIEILPTLKWLDEKRYAENKVRPEETYYDWGKSGDRFTKTTRNFYQQLLAPAYLKMGDTAKAALAMFKGDLKYRTTKGKAFADNMSYQTLNFWQNNLSPKTMLALANLKLDPKMDKLDGLLSSGLNKLNNDDFNELFGTAYLRTHEYAKALAYFNKVSVKYAYFTPTDWYSSKENQKTYANPFIERVNDYPKKYGNKAPGVNKKIFAQEMLRLQKLTITDKANAAQYYYKMANAVYQTGYYGNAWFLTSYDWSSYEVYDPPKFSYDADYKLATQAKLWYLKARALTKDINLKAKCTFMLAKCEQKKIVNQYYGNLNWYDDDYKERNRKFLNVNYNNPYFKEMKAKYATAPYYKIAVGECSYYREFLKGR